MPKCYQLIGVPASGKSTWVAEQEWATGCCIISTDYWVEEEAKRQGKTYSEVFKDVMPNAVNYMAKTVVDAVKNKQDIVWDQTSTTKYTRAKKLRMLPDYETIAVVFKTPADAELAKRLASREGKNIPADIMKSMIVGWEEPTEAEGFDKIIYVG